MSWILASFILIISSSLWAKESKFTDKEINKLVNTMKKHKELNHSDVVNYFNQKKLVKIETVVPKNVFNKQRKRNYENFHNSYSTHVSRKFMRKWRTQLSKAEKTYSVDKEAVVAILLVETGLGSLKGRYHVPSVFSSILIGSESQLDEYINEETLKDYKETNFYKKLQRKKKWAEQQLISLIRLQASGKLDSHNLYGSSSGAFGLCQFIPSSFEKWAVDGDKSGTINLGWKVDAIHSAAHYLQQHGWKKGLHHKSNRKSVYAYNHSEIYVDTILEVAKRLQKKN